MNGPLLYKRKKKGISKIFNKIFDIKDTYTGGFFEKDEITLGELYYFNETEEEINEDKEIYENENTNEDQDINEDEEEEKRDFDFSYVILGFINPLASKHYYEYKRNTIELIDVFATIGALFSTLNFIFSTIFRFYSKNFDNYKIIQSLLQSYIINKNETTKIENFHQLEMSRIENIISPSIEDSEEKEKNKEIKQKLLDENSKPDEKNIIDDTETFENKINDKNINVYEMPKLTFFDFFHNNIFIVLNEKRIKSKNC